MSVVKCNRSAFLATSSGRSGSWIGTSPRASDSTFSAKMSRAHTSWPSSAKQAAVTSPTQPTPITPIGSLSSVIEASRLPRDLERPHRSGDREHLLLAERQQQRVGDPVDRLRGVPGDETQAVAVVGQLVDAAADLACLGDGLEDRRVAPCQALEAVVLARATGLEHHAVPAVALAVRAAEGVDARRPGVDRALQAQGRVERRQPLADPVPARCDGLERLVLAEARGVLEPAHDLPELLLALGSLDLLARFRPRAGRVLDVEELVRHLAYLLGARLHVAGAERPAEADLLDRVGGGPDRELQQTQHRLAVAQRTVGAGVAAEDVTEPIALVDQVGGGDLLLGLAQEVLLARGPHDVGVLVAEAHVLKRLATAHPLVPGLD